MRADRLQAAASTCSSRDADGDTFLLAWPPEGSSSMDKETVEANIKAFAAELHSQLSALNTDAHVQRILPSKCKATKTRAGSQALRSRPDAQIVCVSTSCVCDLVVLARAVLTVNPAVSACCAGKVPMLKDNRFILQSHSSGSARFACADRGYVGQLPGPDGKPGGNDGVLP